MSTVAEVKNAVEHLSPEEKLELFHWLSARRDFQAHRLQELRQEIAVGIAQADQNELGPLDIEAVKNEARERLARGK
jgi:hypothetical protein